MENKNNISKQDFLKLLNADEPPKTEHLDDFEKEALEGLKLIKNPSMLNSIDKKIDTKLTELILNEKKGGTKFGLYVLSIAASIALLAGLFFLFKKADINNEKEVASVMNNKKSFEEDRSAEIDSDEKLVAGKAEISTGKNNLEQKSIDAKNSNLKKSINEKDMQLASALGKEEKRTNKHKTIIDNEKDSSDKTPTNTSIQELFASANDINTAEDDTKFIKEETDKSLKTKIDVDANKKQEDSYATNKREIGTTTPAPSKKDNSQKSNATPPAINRDVTTKQSVFSSPTIPSIPANNNTQQNNNSLATTPISTTNAGVGATSNSYTKSEFNGGQQALDNYIKANLKIPASCVSEEVIIVKITVSITGEVSKPKILSKTGNCSDCEKEAIAFVKQLPKWKPATNKGNPVISTQQIELHFKK